MSGPRTVGRTGRRGVGAAALLAALSLGACDGAVTGADHVSLGAAEAAELGVVLTDQAGTVVDAEMVGESGDLAQSTENDHRAAEVRTRAREFSRTRTCRFGGSVTVEGTALGTWDPDTRTATLDVDAVKLHRNCVVMPGDRKLTLNAAPGLDVAAHRRWVAGEPSGLQTHSLEGKVNWRLEDGRGGTCTVDLLAVFDPDAGTRSVTGEICGRTVDRTSGSG